MSVFYLISDDKEKKRKEKPERKGNFRKNLAKRYRQEHSASEHRQNTEKDSASPHKKEGDERDGFPREKNGEGATEFLFPERNAKTR